MANIELKLNLRKTDNYAFFCPVTKIHLTLTNPVGIADRVSPYIIRALKSKTLIDVNNVINLETGELNTDLNTDNEIKSEKIKKEESVKSETTVTQSQKEVSSQEVEVAVEKKKTTKRGKRAQVNPVDESAKE